MGLHFYAWGVLLGVAVADRAAEDCEACGLAVWRMQTFAAQKQSELEVLKQAKERRAKKSTKAHSKRWLRQEYAVELAATLEEQLDELPKDRRIIQGVCHIQAYEAVQGSELRTGGLADRTGYVDPHRCAERVESRLSELLGETQDDLTQVVLEGAGAGSACERLVPGCTSERATLLLGPQYDEELSDWRALDKVQIGYAPERWTHHVDTDGSSYWFNKAKMLSQREPPDGWAKRADGSWDYRPDAAPQTPEASTPPLPPADARSDTKTSITDEDGEDEHWVDRALKNWDPRKVRENMARDRYAREALHRLNEHAPKPRDEL